VRGGIVRIISDIEGGRHSLRVQNTGTLKGGITSGGFGLSSTQDRLSLLYGERATFAIKQIADNLVEATVAISVTVNQPIYS